jgi:hypothetical protein
MPLSQADDAALSTGAHTAKGSANGGGTRRRNDHTRRAERSCLTKQSGGVLPPQPRHLLLLGAGEDLAPAALVGLSGRPQPQSRDEHRRDIGKSQSMWTDAKMETAGSPRQRSDQWRTARRRPPGRAWVMRRGGEGRGAASQRTRQPHAPGRKGGRASSGAVARWPGALSTAHLSNQTWQTAGWPLQTSG